MSALEIKTVLVAGTGAIGIGVAQSFLTAGFRTQVLSRNPARLSGQLEGAEVSDRLPGDAPDLIVESLPEIANLKLGFYAKVEDAWMGAPILASNTSSLPLQDLANALRYPSRFLGMHYLYPAHLPKLFVEVIRTPQTESAIVDQVLDALRRCDKMPIILNRPVVGGLFNRLQHALLREAYYLIDQGVTSPEQIDEIARHFLAPRMCITGLLQQKDITGLDNTTRTQRLLLPELCDDKVPTRFLESHYEWGHFGLKTGRGFYDWTGADPARVRAAVNAKVARIENLMKEMESDD